MSVRIVARIVLLPVIIFAGFLLGDLLFPLHVDPEYSVIVRDRKGTVLHAFLTSDEKWRMKTNLEEISPVLRKTIVEKEDRYFYYHPGVNHLAIFRALFNNVLSLRRTSGASTITMQVARALEPHERTYTTKVREMLRALQLEWHYSKDEILQLYLNLVPYGGNIEGVKAAALLYLDKNPDHLSLAEVTALSIIPNRPSSLVPGRHNDRIVVERNKWLNKFRNARLFPDAEVDDALAELFEGRRRQAPREIPHLAQRLRYSGETEVTVSIDMLMQSTIERILSDYTNTNALSDIRNGSVIVLDNQTGEVLSYCGSQNFTDSSQAGQVDGVIAIRQPGSTLKPFVYAQAIDQGLLTPRRMIGDVPVDYEGYQPENFDRKFNGPVSVEYALEHSLNIPAVKTLRVLGAGELIDLLSGCGFQQVGKDRRKLGLSMVLGGCGTTLEELTGMYSALARQGRWIRPSFTLKNAGRGRKVFSTAASFMITDILSKINRPDFPLNWQATGKMPKIAWKTGTSYGRKDAWSIGYNRRYTVGVWIGNFSGTGNPLIGGAAIATPLLFRIFNTIDYDSDESWFTMPDDCSQRLVCSESGLPPSEHCNHVVTDYFIPSISDSHTCSDWQEIAVSPDEKISYCKSCQPSNGYRLKWYRMAEPSVLQWYADNRLVFDRPPPHNPDCEELFRSGGPLILSPRTGTEILLNASEPEPILLSCRTDDNESDVYWYVNDRFFRKGNRVFYKAQEGPLKISCTDARGRVKTINVKIKMVDL